MTRRVRSVGYACPRAGERAGVERNLDFHFRLSEDQESKK